jgi:hypothetical protein
MVLKIGGGASRQSIRKALARGGPLTVSYKDVLQAEDIREALAGVHEAGDPKIALPLLAWLASHPNSPEDVLRDLFARKDREVLVSLAMNQNLPAPLQRSLKRHKDPWVREQVEHILSRRRG